MHHRKSHPFLSLFFTAALLLPALTGCTREPASPSTVTETPNPPAVSESELPTEVIEPEESGPDHSHPLFLQQLTADETSPALSYLPEDLLTGMSFTDMAAYGDRILLINQTFQAQAPEAPEEEGTFGYIFDFVIYDPWSHTLSEPLHFDFPAYDSYHILGSRLLLTSSDSGTSAVYDENLLLVAEYDTSELTAISASIAAVSADGSTAYAYSYEFEGLLQIDPADMTWTIRDTDLYSPSPEAVSPDGSLLIVSGVEKKSLRRSIAVIDTASGETLQTENGAPLYGTSADEKGYLRYEEYLGNIWCYQTYEGDSIWYSCPDMTDAMLLGDDRIISRYILTDYDSGEETSRFVLRNLQGDALSSFSFTNGNLREQAFFNSIPASYVYLPELEKVILLCTREDQNYQTQTPWLLVWDLTVPAEADVQALSTYESKDALKADQPGFFADSFVPTQIPDRDSYDWGDLTECRRMADELEETLGIRIYIGPEVPETISEYDITQMTDADMVSDTLRLLKEQLDLYPQNFFPQLAFNTNREVDFYIAGRLAPNSDYVDFDPAAYVTEQDDRLIMVMDARYSWDMSYTLNHELSHMIDRRLAFLASYRDDCLFSDSTWDSYNPESFSYLYDYVDYDSKADFASYSDWFIDSYGMTFPTEDRAMIFGYAMEAYSGNDWREVLNPETVIFEKLGYYAQCIRDGFDTEGWEEVQPWEKYLRNTAE